MIQTLALQPDGKIVTGGQFSKVNGITRSSLARLDRDGSLDENFFAGGKIEGPPFNLNPATTGTSSLISSIVIRPDGKVVVAGSFTNVNGIQAGNVVRLNPDGTLDREFAVTPGPATTVWSMENLTDQKLLIAGTITTNSGFVMRLNADGSRDPTFDAAGAVTGPVYAVRIQGDGKVVLAGALADSGNVNQNRPVIRLHADGRLDTTFQFSPSFNAMGFSMALQADGRILVGGVFKQTTGTTSWSGLMRLDATGRIDLGFDPSPGANDGPIVGIPRFGGGPWSAVRSILITDSSTALIAGNFGSFNLEQRVYFCRVFTTYQAAPLLNPAFTDGMFSVSVPTLPGTN